MNRSALTAGVVGTLVVALIILFATSGPDTGETGSSPLVGKPAPAIVGTDSKDRPFDLAQYRGKWVLVNFFATWCAPCVQEHPELVAFSDEHATTGDAAVVSVAYDEKADAVTKFFEKNGGDWAVLAAGTEDFSLRYGVIKLPESYLINPKGTIVHKFIGGVTAQGIDAQIAKG